MNKLKGGLSDNKTIGDLSNKHKISIDNILSQLNKGIKIEMEHTTDKQKAKEIAMDHLYEDPKYYDKLKKIEVDEKWSEKYKKSIDCSNPKGFSQRAHCQGKKKETKEATGASSSGSFEGPFLSDKPIRRDIGTYHNAKLDEALGGTEMGSYDVPFLGTTPKGRKNPLKIDGPESIKKSRAVKDKNFPKWGGPKGIYIKIKEKCKKFPYCNQGDINAIEVLKESINDMSKKYGIPKDYLEQIIINEIKTIFI